MQTRCAQKPITIRSDRAASWSAVLTSGRRSQAEVVEQALEAISVPIPPDESAAQFARIALILNELRRRTDIPSMAEFEAREYDARQSPSTVESIFHTSALVAIVNGEPADVEMQAALVSEIGDFPAPALVEFQSLMAAADNLLATAPLPFKPLARKSYLWGSKLPMPLSCRIVAMPAAMAREVR